ncbi:hypothetical protein DYD21_05850 [Rhodohalobacter sp. SW132]|uniref:TolB family protein n=1 Tax=Rhodohalobacter sp. SW132 TaxID=2293433 RepID=UPI000E248022|nr:PD40 domain-containing protein [Rhodohalobacter sp. SW132]REL38131.1 hypothetical protein DYD21_05850 [Rhodohalobacter sp. SW132]
MKLDTIKKASGIFILPLLLIFSGCDNPFQSKDKGEYKIAFDIRNSSNNVKDIYLMNTDGSNKIQLTQRPSDVDEESYYGSENPVWSPDGKRILYKSHQNWKTNLYTITPDGKELSQVTNFSGNEYANKFAWSPNGSKIAVSTDLGIYILKDNGDSQERITDKPVWDLSWSPDGSRISFTTIVQSDDSTSNMGVINVINADGSNLRELTAKEKNGRFPSWVPGSNEIVWTGGDWANEKSITIMNANGEDQQELTSEYLPTALAVSPDGNRIAFHHYVRLYVHDLYVVDIAGKGLKN